MTEQTTDRDERTQAAVPPLGLVQGGMPVAWQTSVTPGPAGQHGVLLRLEHATGATVLLLPAQAAERMAHDLRDAVTEARRPRLATTGTPAGLIVPRTP